MLKGMFLPALFSTDARYDPPTAVASGLAERRRCFCTPFTLAWDLGQGLDSEDRSFSGSSFQVLWDLEAVKYNKEGERSRNAQHLTVLGLKCNKIPPSFKISC